MANALQEMVLASPDLTFTLPERILLQQYPAVLRDFKKHVLKLKKMKFDLERELENRKNLLQRTEYKALGTNKEERDAGFCLLLNDDAEYRGYRDDIEAIDWTLKDQDIEIEKLESDFKTLMLRRREAVVASELFGGIPLTDTEKPF